MLCVVQGDPEGALRVFQQMKAHQVAPDACTYLALFQAFNHGRKPDRAEPAAGDAAAERGVAEQLLRLEEDMRGAGVQHTAQTHTALVSRRGGQSAASAEMPLRDEEPALYSSTLHGVRQGPGALKCYLR